MKSYYAISLSLDVDTNIEEAKDLLGNQLQQMEDLAIEDCTERQALGLTGGEIVLSFLISIAANLTCAELEKRLKAYWAKSEKQKTKGKKTKAFKLAWGNLKIVKKSKSQISQSNSKGSSKNSSQRKKK